MFFVRTCNHGENAVSFAAIEQVEKGNAEGIHNALKSALTNSDHLAIR